MMRPTGELAVDLCVQPMNMRKQIAGLSTFVQGDPEPDAFAPA